MLSFNCPSWRHIEGSWHPGGQFGLNIKVSKPSTQLMTEVLIVISQQNSEWEEGQELVPELLRSKSERDKVQLNEQKTADKEA